MTKIKALLLAAVVLSGAGLSHAVEQRRGPKLPNGQYSEFPAPGGYDYSRKSSTAEEVLCSGRCVLVGLFMSTGNPVAAQLTIRDTAQANGSATALGPIRFRRDSEELSRHVLPVPVYMSNGISAQISSVATGEAVTVLYLDLDD